ncbi:hypothetical protein, partial [Staphylococcus condimenti]|uniref:hypothetical protein n=1 Tax=Staphylococcus condimenti TaxID=70255 RepID=UPI001022CE4D
DEISNEFYEMNKRDGELMKQAVPLLPDYIHHTQKRNMNHIEAVQAYEAEDYMKMDYYAKRNLELTVSISLKSKKGRLLW